MAWKTIPEGIMLNMATIEVSTINTADKTQMIAMKKKAKMIIGRNQESEDVEANVEVPVEEEQVEVEVVSRPSQPLKSNPTRTRNIFF
jgi:hypothetical protein